jgi:hypothetical protein
MLATELRRPLGEYGSVQPLCPSCGRTMHLARTKPQSDGLPDQCIFKCGECGVWLTESADERRSV